MSRPQQSPGADRCSDVMQQHQVKLAAWCPAGEYRVCFNAPLEPFCLDKCPFSNHTRAEDDWLGLIESHQLTTHTPAVLHHRSAHCFCLGWRLSAADKHSEKWLCTCCGWSVMQLVFQRADSIVRMSSYNLFTKYSQSFQVYFFYSFTHMYASAKPSIVPDCEHLDYATNSY